MELLYITWETALQGRGRGQQREHGAGPRRTKVPTRGGVCVSEASPAYDLFGCLKRQQGPTRGTFSSGVRAEMVHPLGQRKLGRINPLLFCVRLVACLAASSEHVEWSPF